MWLVVSFLQLIRLDNDGFTTVILGCGAAMGLHKCTGEERTGQALDVMTEARFHFIKLLFGILSVSPACWKYPSCRWIKLGNMSGENHVQATLPGVCTYELWNQYLPFAIVGCCWWVLFCNAAALRVACWIALLAWQSAAVKKTRWSILGTMSVHKSVGIWCWDGGLRGKPHHGHGP